HPADRAEHGPVHGGTGPGRPGPGPEGERPMTDLEDRLRAELDDFAQRANPATIRPLQPPPGRAARQAPRRMRRWLAPVAAATAVAAVIAGVTLAVRPAG